MSKDIFTREWIIKNSIEVVSEYEKGILTIRALHYQLVGLGMTNDMQHYKRVVGAMEQARWDNLIDFDVFSDRDRAMVGDTPYRITEVDEKVREAKIQVGLWMNNYSKNKWENQPYYPIVLIEKKALEGVFDKPCLKHQVALGACKGYPSLTFVHDLYNRFVEADSDYNKKPVIIYFGDYDPSGDDIPKTIVNNLDRFGVEVELRRIALNHDQVMEWNLPAAPTKDTDSRTANWGGIGQVELDAVRPEKLINLLDYAIEDIFDEDLYAELMQQEIQERKQFRHELKNFVNDL
jgi:hypothetical protein